MHTDMLRPHALLDTPTATVHTDTLRPHALLDTPTATIPPHPSLPWHEASVWTSKAWDEVSYNRRRVDRWDRPSHRRTDGRTLDRFITHTAKQGSVVLLTSSLAPAR